MEQITPKQIYEKLLQLELAIKKMDKHFEDLEFIERTEKAWKEIDEGKGKTYSVEEFRKRLKNG